MFASSPRAILTALAVSLAAGVSAHAQAPTITSFSPTSSSTYNIWVYIKGTNLSGGTVKFNGTPSSRFDSYGTYGYALLPTGATTGRITVTTAYGTATSATNFVVTATPPPSAPTISSFTPASGAVGASVTISGANFTGATAVRFNGTSATFTVNSASQITATVPAGATSGAITVVTPNGTATSASNFTVQTSNANAPTITRFDPPSSNTYNVWIYIEGTNLTGGTVKFNGTPATDVVWYSSNYGYAMLPTGATTGPITVTTANGTGTSATNFVVGATPPPSAPSISSFTPTSGAAGTAVTISGANFTGATAVRFNGTSATFTVNSASQISTSVPAGASTGAITVVTPNGTATSASNFTVPVPVGAPTVTSFTPTTGSAGTTVTLTGTNFTGATAVRFFNNVSATFTVNSATQITTTVPAGAATGPISVTNATGTGTSASSFTVGGNTGTVDYYPSKVLVGQATQNSSGTMRMAQDKRGWVQVFMVANASNTLKPAVRIQCMVNGAQVYETTVAAPSGNAGVPTTAPAYGNFTNTYVANIPATAFKPGMSVIATADPTSAVPDSNRANNSLTATVDVRNTYPFRITLVPLQIYYGGAYYTGAVNTGNVSQFMEMFQHIWPVPEAYDSQVHSTYYTSTIPYADYSSGWETVLNELGALQRAEGTTNRYYYGVYKPYYGTAGGSGMAWLGSPQAMGVDWDNMSSTFTWKAGTVAHEVGHSLNLNHAPGCGAGSPDPSYPYSGATLGTYGRDAWLGTVYAPNSYYDVMAYCGYSWVSDYNVNKVMDFRLSGDTTVPLAGPQGVELAAAKGQKKSVKLIFGTVENGIAKLRPAFDIEAVPDAPQAEGEYGVELMDASGRTVGQTRFQPMSTVHGNPNVKGFVMAVAQDEAPAAAGVAAVSGGAPSFRIHHNGETLALVKGRSEALASLAPGAPAQPEIQALRLADGRVRVISPNAAGLMIKNEKGEVITICDGGDVSVPTKSTRLKVYVSYGAGSTTHDVSVQ